MLSTTSIIIGLVFASLYDSVQALIFLGYAPLITFIMLSSEHIKHSKSGINKSTESLVSDTLTNIKTVKALQIEQRFITEFETRCKESNKGLFTEALIKGAIMASFCSTLIAILATIQLVGAQRVENNSINREDLLVCVFVLIGVSWTYYILAPILADGVVAVSSIRNLIRIFMKPPVIDAKD